MTGKRLGRFKSLAVQGLSSLPKESRFVSGHRFRNALSSSKSDAPLGAGHPITGSEMSRAPWPYPGRTRRIEMFHSPDPIFPGRNSRTRKPNRRERHLNCRFVPEFDVQPVAPSGFQRCSTAQLQVCSGVQMPLSPLVSAEVPAVSVAVQDPLSGLAQPFPIPCHPSHQQTKSQG